MDYNPQFIRQAQYVIWVQWVFFNLLGWAFGLFATWGTQTSTMVRFGWIAAFLAIGQWLVIRKYLRRPSWMWIVMSAVGMMAAQFVTQTLVESGILTLRGAGFGGGLVFGGIIGVLIGGLMALGQSPFINQSVASVRDWLVVSVVGWGLGFQAGTILGFIWLGADLRFTSLIAALMSAMITGLWVTQLIQPRG